MPPKGAPGGAVDFEPVLPLELAPVVSTEHRPISELPPVFEAPPAGWDPEADPKAVAAEEKEYVAFWGEAATPFEDPDFNRDALPILEPEQPSGLTFGSVTGWRRVRDWLSEMHPPQGEAAAEAEGEEAAAEPAGPTLCVVSVVGATDEEVDRTVLRHQKIPEAVAVAAPAEGEEGEEVGEEENNEPPPMDPEVAAALEKLNHEGARRIRGFRKEACEQSQTWLGGLLGMLVSIRKDVPQGDYLWENIYPKDNTGKPALSPNGKYVVRLWVYGEWRSVVVDDFVPFGADGRPLLLRTLGTSVNGEDAEVELWPMLLAKAALKVFGRHSDGSALRDAMAYGSAICGCSMQQLSSSSMGSQFENQMKQAAQSPTCTMGLLVPGAGQSVILDGVDELGVHAVCEFQVAKTSMGSVEFVRLQSTRSEYLCKHENGLVKLPGNSDGMARDARETDRESKFLQLAAAVDWLAEKHSSVGVMSSFWVAASQVTAMFGSVVIMQPISSMPNKGAVSHDWEAPHEQPLGRPPSMLICCDNPEPTELVFCLGKPPVTWSAPEEEAAEPDGDAPAPETPTEPALPMTAVTAELWDWQLASTRCLASASTRLMASASMRLGPGPQLVRLNLDAPLGYISTVSSMSPFSCGPIETVLKENLGLSSVSTLLAPIPATPSGATRVAMRLNINCATASNVAVYVEVSEKSLEPYLSLSLVDRKSQRRTPYMSLFVPAVKMEPTAEGYTVMLESMSRIGKPALASSNATVYVISESPDVTCELDPLAEARQSCGDKDLNLAKDTVILKYLLQPTEPVEVCAVQLLVKGTDRQVEMRLFENDTKEIMAAKGVKGLCTMMYMPLRQPEGAESVSTWTLAVSVLAPDAATAVKEKAAKESLLTEPTEAAEGEDCEVEAAGAGPSCSYELVLQSVTPFGISIDTQRQTAVVEMKEQWETDEKGRAERAKLARESFLSPPAAEEAETNPKKQMEAKAPTKISCENPEAAPVLTEEQRAERLTQLEQTQDTFTSGHTEKAEGRGAVMTKWTAGNEARAGAWQEVKQSVEDTFANDTTRRDTLIAELTK